MYALRDYVCLGSQHHLPGCWQTSLLPFISFYIQEVLNWHLKNLILFLYVSVHLTVLQPDLCVKKKGKCGYPSRVGQGQRQLSISQQSNILIRCLARGIGQKAARPAMLFL